MTTKLNCTVCAYTDIEGNICPNCATDLYLIRMLQQLPQIISCPDEDLWLTQGTRGADEEAETRIRFYDQQLGHELEAEGVIGGYSTAIQDYLFRDLVGAVCNLFAQGGKLYGLLKIAIWLGVTLFILTVGIGLGVVGCFLYFNPPTSAQVVFRHSHNDDSWKPSMLHSLLKTQHSATPVASGASAPIREPVHSYIALGNRT